MISNDGDAVAKAPWLDYLEREILEAREEEEAKFALLFKAFLLSEASTAVKDAASAIYDVIKNDSAQEAEPGTKDLIVCNYLECFWENIYQLAPFMPYKEDKQDTLVKLIVELQNMPPIVFHYDDVCISRLASSGFLELIFIGSRSLLRGRETAQVGVSKGKSGMRVGLPSFIYVFHFL